MLMLSSVSLVLKGCVADTGRTRAACDCDSRSMLANASLHSYLRQRHASGQSCRGRRPYACKALTCSHIFWLQEYYDDIIALLKYNAEYCEKRASEIPSLHPVKPQAKQSLDRINHIQSYLAHVVYPDGHILVNDLYTNAVVFAGCHVHDVSHRRAEYGH